MASETDPAPADEVEVVWRLRASSDRILECAIWRVTHDLLELKAGYDLDDQVLRSEHVATLEDGRRIAESWREGVLEKGGFEVVTEAE